MRAKLKLSNNALRIIFAVNVTNYSRITRRTIAQRDFRDRSSRVVKHDPRSVRAIIKFSRVSFNKIIPRRDLISSDISTVQRRRADRCCKSDNTAFFDISHLVRNSIHVSYKTALGVPTRSGAALSLRSTVTGDHETPARSGQDKVRKLPINAKLSPAREKGRRE